MGGEGVRFEKKIKSDIFGKKEIDQMDDYSFPLENVEELEKYVNSRVQTPVRASAFIAYNRIYYYLEKEEIRITLDFQIQTEDLIFGRKRNLSDFF